MTGRTRRRLVWLLALIMLAGNPAGAHETTRSYVTLSREGPLVSMQVRMAFRDIEVVVWMDEDLDGQITWGEATRRLDAVAAYVGAAISLTSGGICTLARSGADALDSGGIAYLDLTMAGRCGDAATPLVIRSRLFAEVDPDHRTFLTATAGGTTTTALLSASNPELTLSGATGGLARSFANYFRAGVEHLLGGADHLIFLLILMLPAVTSGGTARRAALGVLGAVTGFTLAHAITLTAATTELLRPPTRIIEILIAASIIVTAIDNVRPFIPAPRAAVAAFFGIIHGFGFATALAGLHLTGGGLAVALVAFNLGIEAAQIIVVLVTLPALYMLGGGRVLLWLGSGAAGLIGLYWLVIRILA